MAVSSASGDLGPDESVTCSRSSSSNGKAPVSSKSGDMSDDNETKGGKAFDRISRLNRATKRLRNIRGLHDPFFTSAGFTKQRKLLHHNAAPAAYPEEEDDIAEAIARSLRDVSAKPPNPQTENHYGLDKLDSPDNELMDFTPSRQSRKPARQARSYSNLGSSSASTAAAPHEALHGLLNAMDASVKTLEECAREGIEVDARELADVISRWQHIVRKVIRASESSERGRIKDLEAQLDFDRDVEEAHQNTITKLDQSWMEMMHEKEQEWQKELDQVQQAIGARLQPDEPNEMLTQLYATDMHPAQDVQRRC